MSSFFTIPGAQKKRKRPEGTEAPKKRFATSKTSSRESRESKSKAPPRKPQRDESISGSDSESDEPAPQDDADTSGSESGEDETAAERRLRLAERYLENIRDEVIDPEGFDAEDIDRDLIAERLKEDVAESKGRIYRKLAGELAFTEARHSSFRNNTETVTAIATCAPWAYTVSKDVSLTKWKIQDLPSEQYKNKKKKKKSWKPPPPKRVPEQVCYVRGDRRKAKDNAYQGHVDAILCVVASQDGKYVVTGGRDRRIIVWDAPTLKPLRVFSQHRDAVTGLAFRRGTNQMYSASKDRTIKVWSLDELAYVETLFGHQDEVVDVAALAQERCVSVGARDRTARLWKVVEETQLVFRGGGSSKKAKGSVLEGSMDRVALLDEEMFVTGSDNGSLSLWTMHKKKPIFTLPLAHGLDPPLTPDEASAESHPSLTIVPPPQPRWITALTTIPYSDIILSGSWDGHVRAWKLSDDKKKIEEIGAVSSLPSSSSSSGSEETPSEIPSAKGVVNDISVFERGDRGKDGLCIVAATGKEHRLGSWQRRAIPGARNGAVVYEVSRVVEEKKVNGNGPVEDLRSDFS